MAVFGPAPLDVVEVTGADRVDYLEAVTTQRLADARPGEVRGAMVLDAHGAPQATWWVAVHAERLLLLGPPAAADHAMDVLATRTFLSDASFDRLDLPVWSLRGEDLGGTLAEIGATALPAGAWRPVGGSLVVHHAFGVEIVGEDLVDRLREAHGVEEVDADGLAAARVRAGEPDPGREVAAPHLPEELGLLPTHVHLAKGCYPGQEAVARMWMLGRPRRRLVVVDVEGDVEAGFTVGTGRERVEVTAAADGVGLAFAPPALEVGSRVDGDHGAVTIARVVGEGVAVPGADEAGPRRRDR